jgi:hypothetical protein
MVRSIFSPVDWLVLAAQLFRGPTETHGSQGGAVGGHGHIRFPSSVNRRASELENEMLWLTEEEVVSLTGYKHRKKQLQVLAMLKPKPDYRIRPHDSFPLIPRAQFEAPARKHG